MTGPVISLEQLCAGLNAFCILLPAAFSLGMTQLYRQPYFRAWTINYAFSFSILVVECGLQGPGHPPLMTGLQVVGFLGSSWFSLAAADALAGWRTTGRKGAAVTAGTAASYVLACSSGLPHPLPLVPPLVYWIASQLCLGVAITRRPRPDRLGYWVGTALIATALWVLTYPFLATSPYFWVGYLTSAVLHLVTGMLMMLYLMSDLVNQLHRDNAELLVADRTHLDFLGTVSHEVRTPLTALELATHLLEAMDASGMSAKQRELVGIIRHNTSQLAALIAQVLDYARLGSGSARYDFEVLELGELLLDARLMHSHLYEQQGVALAVELPQEQVLARVDRERMGQVLTNLLGNALKFTRPGGHVSLTLVAREDAARIEVADDGIGIPPGELERVFTRFYQIGHASRASSREGSVGLGLGICRAIVEEGHGGRIWAEDRQGPGALLVVSLPLAQLSPSTPPDRPLAPGSA